MIQNTTEIPEESTPIFDRLQQEYLAKERYDELFPDEES